MTTEAEVTFLGVFFLASLMLEYLDALGCVPYLIRPLVRWCGLGGTTLSGVFMWCALARLARGD